MVGFSGSLNEHVDLSTAATLTEFGLDWLMHGKFYSIFSLLFGIGFALQLGRLEARGEGVGRYMRRLAILLGFGVLHIVLLWKGDMRARSNPTDKLMIPIQSLAPVGGQTVLADQPYAEQIAYKMNDVKPVDVREILYYLAVFDCSAYDEKRHPVALFGRKEGIVRRFADQARDAKAGDSFSVLISKAPEILWLRDTIEKRALSFNVGRYKVGKGTRVRSQSYRDNQLVFLNEQVNGKIPLGWIMPMLAGFRANVDWNRPKGTFSWIMPLDELVDACIEGLVLGIQDVHEQENARPEYVGRNSLSWRISYNVVSQAILERQLAQAKKGR